MLKNKLISAPCLAHPDMTRPFSLQIDASIIAVGGVLLQQKEDGRERHVRYFSKKLSPTQKRYCTFEKECLGIVLSCEHFRVYLLARPFRLRTDHKALQWLYRHEPKSSSKIAGWIATLQEYPIEIQYIRGSENTIADILSRMHGFPVEPEPEPVFPGVGEGVPSRVCPVSGDENQENQIWVDFDWAVAQNKDEKILKLKNFVKKGKFPKKLLGKMRSSANMCEFLAT